MNLNRDPTRAQLKALLFAGDDEASHHVLWVDKLGEVHVDPIGIDPEMKTLNHWRVGTGAQIAASN